jgi:hypothetical protein
MHQKALRLPPISELDWYLLVNYIKKFHQIVKKNKKVVLIRKGSRNTFLIPRLLNHNPSAKGPSLCL